MSLRETLGENTQHSPETNIHAPAGFERTVPASERLQTHALDSAATGLGQSGKICKISLPS
jgi:hypothetical protein